MLYSLCEFELLRATNAIACNWGGRHLGTIGPVDARRDEAGQLHLYTGGTYRNQWLISVELDDEAAPFGEQVAPQDHEWHVRLGFCQTNVTRAPDGGWSLTIPPELLCLCPTCDHVVDLFACMLGRAAERQRALEAWYQSVQDWRRRHHPIALAINAYVRPDLLRHQLAQGLID